MVASHARVLEQWVKARPLIYGDWDRWPADAQPAFLGFSWGGVPLPGTWPKLVRALKAQDFDTAANECAISGPISAQRNQAHKLMFQNAAKVKKYRLDVTLLNWPAVLLDEVMIEIAP